MSATEFQPDPSFPARKTTVKALRVGDTLSNCANGKPGKTIERIEKARTAGYLVGFYTDGSWSALGHRDDVVWIMKVPSGGAP